MTTVRWLLLGVFSLGVSLILCHLLLRLAPRFGMLDQPDPFRKVHRNPTPRGGGIGIAIAYLLGLLMLRLTTTAAENFDDIPAAFILVALGFIDYRVSISWQVRLLVQTLCAVSAVLHFFPMDLFLAVAAVFWIVGLINAFNMLDNMDLLSGGTALIAAGWLALAGMQPAEHII